MHPALACCVAGLLVAAATPTPTRPPATRTPTPTATVRPAPPSPTPLPTSTPSPAPAPAPAPSATPTLLTPLIPTPAPGPDTAPVEQVQVGWSAQGRRIDAYLLGQAPQTVLIVGDIHGAPERNTSMLVWDLMSTFAGDARLLPSGVGLAFIPEANPDGLANGTRELADGVDPNRNFPTSDWAPASFGPDGYLPMGGGPAPLSEAETQALAVFVGQRRPSAVISYHSAAALVMGGPTARATGLFDAYIRASGYRGDDWTAYPVGGDFAEWCDLDLQIPTVEIELTDHFDPEVERNLAGVLAVLQQLTSNPPY